MSGFKATCHQLTLKITSQSRWLPSASKVCTSDCGFPLPSTSCAVYTPATKGLISSLQSGWPVLYRNTGIGLLFVYQGWIPFRHVACPEPPGPVTLRIVATQVWAFGSQPIRPRTDTKLSLSGFGPHGAFAPAATKG